MKRIISYLLAAVLIIMPCQQIFAAEIGNGTTESIEGDDTSVPEETESETGDAVRANIAQVEETPKEGEEKRTEDVQTEKLGMKEDRDNIGQIDVTIRSAVVLEKEVEFIVSLTEQSRKTIVLEADSGELPAEGSVTFEGLKSGKYTLKVSAPGFAEYAQEIEVDGWAYAVQLMTGFVSGYDYDKGNVHPGVLLIGDVDKSGVINDADKDTLIDAIDSGKNTALSDLNHDGVSDIVDLEYFVKGYKADGDINSSVEVSVPGAVVSAANDSGTLVEGSLDSVLKDEGNITLSREDGTAISGEHPVIMTFDITQESSSSIDGIVIETVGGNPITEAAVEITYINKADGQEDLVQVPIKEGIDFLLKNEDVKVTRSADGSICIYLGSQIAVKKVTLKITGLKKNNDLAEISRVEFVNGMENRIPEPQMDIPQNLKVQTGNKTFTATWDACVNVTGYEVMISCDGKDEVRTVRGNMLVVSSFNGDKLVNKKEYEVKVQSVNGTWRSGYGQSAKAVPAADKKPDAPDNLKTTGQYRAVTAAWKNMEDTDFYNLYYKKSSESSYLRFWRLRREEIKMIRKFRAMGAIQEIMETAEITETAEIAEAAAAVDRVRR